jgi:hypothetical protein
VDISHAVTVATEPESVCGDFGRKSY